MHFAVNTCAFIVLSAIFQFIDCHPTGAPEAVCEDLLPHHGAQPQSSKSPYILTGRPLKNHSIELTIESEDHTPFRGFAIQARLANSTSGAIGKFVAKGKDAHTINCFDSPDNTITHSDRSDKHELTVEWIPPTEHDHDMEVVFVGTVVQTTKTFWTSISSEKLSLTADHDHNTVDEHPHSHKDTESDQSSHKTNSSSDRSGSYLLISSFILLLFRKI